MQFLTLYFILLKAMLTSFTGLSSLALIRHDLVEQRHWLNDTQLNAAVMIGRSTPGPMGVYIVPVGYFVAGPSGAAAGLLALMTPALLVIPLFRRIQHHTSHPRFQSAIRFVVIGGSAYSAAALFAMAPTALPTLPLLALAGLSAALLLRTNIPTIFLLAGAALLALVLN